MMHRVWGLAWVLAAACGMAQEVRPAAAPAAAAAAIANTVITSDKMEFDYQRRTAVFDGHVVVVDPQMRMESQQLTVLFGEDQSIKQATAVGDVVVTNPEIRATCKRAVYSGLRGQIVLTGNAVLTRERDSVSGDTITYWVAEQKIECERSTLVITPSRGGNNKGAALDGLLKRKQ